MFYIFIFGGTVGEALTFTITIATIAQIVLAASLLISQMHRVKAFMPLSALLLVLLSMILEPVLAEFFPTLRVAGFTLMLPALLALAPLLWLYIEALTAETDWHLARRHIKHFVLPFTGVILFVLLMLLPGKTLESLLFGNPESLSGYVGGLMIAVFVLVILWTGQSGWYLLKIFKCLAHYQIRLKDFFANTEKRDLLWLKAYTLLLCCIWGLAAATVLLDNLMAITLIDRTGYALLILVLVWLLCFWGLRQHPGFEGHYLKSDEESGEQMDEAVSAREKYQKSALDKESAQRIANKIESMMEEESLYLDASISLTRLAEISGISPNYLSQTLNGTLGSNFFDYVNGWRIKEAKRRLRQTDDSIITIAYGVGFNARSSFYKAFKEKTGVTPSQYRQTA